MQMTTNRVMKCLKTSCRALNQNLSHVYLGTVGRWNGRFVGYKYCQFFNDLQNAISGYDAIIIKLTGTRLHFTPIHHDGRHEMELRRFNEYTLSDENNDCFDCFN